MISNELLNQLQELTQSVDLSPAFESAIHNLMVSSYKEGYGQGYDDGKWSNLTVFITNEGEQNWEKGDYVFDTMNNILDEKLEEQLQKEIKARKRQELIARLTGEEKELLNLK